MIKQQLIATWHEPPEMVAALDHNQGYMPFGSYPRGFQTPTQDEARSLRWL
jgi:hypothetical protein